MRRFCGVIVALVVGVILNGCAGGASGPKTGQVSGTVTYQGKPVSGVTVVFHPSSGPVATGTTDDSGEFQLMTSKPGDGAPVGMCKVTISAPTPVGESDPAAAEKAAAEAAAQSKIPAKYQSPDSSGLTYDVKEGQNDAKFDLTD